MGNKKDLNPQNDPTGAQNESDGTKKLGPGSKVTLSDRANETSTDAPGRPSDILDYIQPPSSLLDFSEGQSDEHDSAATKIVNPLLQSNQDEELGATCAYVPPDPTEIGGTAYLPADSPRTKSPEEEFSLAPQPNIDSRLHSRSGSDKHQARIPKQIGSYSIERVLGRGGMGIVYKAFQTKLGRPVALKMILAGSHASDQVLSRFIAEAKAVAHLQHPNIVQIFEVGEHDGLPFFSLEYVNGPPLDKKLDGKPIPPDQAARWMIDICTAMQYAHDNGVLHRDLKPANVLSTKDGILKVSDFGLAKRLEDNADSASTREGTIMGTPNYMSPEQARGEVHNLGPATDQYSLGAMLYEFLTGRPPFMAPKPLETIMQVIHNEPIPPRQLQPKLPIDIETICLKALQKDPAKRYASCNDLAADLKRYLNREPILARPVGKFEQAWRWYLRNQLVGNLALATALGLISVAGVSAYAAYSLNSKNKALEISEQETKKQAQIARKAESQALANEKLANDRADGLIKTTQQFYKELKQIDPNQSPRIKEGRDQMMRTLLPMLREHILSQKPDDEAGRLTAAALALDYGTSMVQYGMKQDAKAALTEAETFFRERAEQKKSDAAKSNYLQVVRVWANMERELNRDLDQSLLWYQKQLDIAQQMVQSPTADDKGQGILPWYQSSVFQVRAVHELAVTYLRIGQMSKVLSLSDQAQSICRNSIDRLSQELENKELSDEQRKQMKIADATFKEMRNTSELLLGAYRFRSGQIEQAEPKLRSGVEQLKTAYEKDVNNSALLRQYVLQLGLFSELLCQSGQPDQGIEGLEKANELGKKLLSFAPDNSDFIRAATLSAFRLTQWRKERKISDADAPGIDALAQRRKKSEKDQSNDVARMDWMMSEAQVGDATKAVELAQGFLNHPKVDNELLVLIARTYCLLASRSDKPEDTQGYLNKAVESIQRAISQGFEDVGLLKTEIDLHILNEQNRMQAILDAIQDQIDKSK
ncbi:MAG: serine/threonine protein kinase [Pirellula sp.]